jgi:hypothetical protein
MLSRLSKCQNVTAFRDTEIELPGNELVKRIRAEKVIAA